MEQAIIGAALVESYALKEVLERMDPEWLYVDAHRVIFKMIAQHVMNGEKLDVILLSQWLSNAGVLGDIGGQMYLADCMDKCSTSAHTSAYISEVRALYYDRQIKYALIDVTADPSPENIEKLRAKREEKDGANAQGILSLKDCGDKVRELTSPLAKGMYEIFGMTQADEYHNGATAGDILTIAARPGVGKTVLATAMAVNFARKYQEPVLYFSTEMTYEETLQRILSPLSGVPGWKFRKRYFDKEGEDLKKINAAAEELKKLNIFIVDKPSPTLAVIRAAMAATRAKIVFVDYLQVVNMEIQEDEGKPAAYGRFLYGWKESLRGLGALGVAMCQMNRDVDHLTKTQRPQLADLKDSGDIEQISNSVMLMWKYNKKDRDTRQPIVPEIRNVKPIEMIHAKNRTGKADVSVQLVFDENFIQFHEWTPEVAMKYNDQIMAAPKCKEKKHGKADPGAGWSTKLPGNDATEEPEEGGF
jgi:replicative DNA helicase